MLTIILIPKGLPIAGLVYLLEGGKPAGISVTQNPESKSIKESNRALGL